MDPKVRQRTECTSSHDVTRLFHTEYSVSCFLNEGCCQTLCRYGLHAVPLLNHVAHLRQSAGIIRWRFRRTAWSLTCLSNSVPCLGANIFKEPKVNSNLTDACEDCGAIYRSKTGCYGTARRSSSARSGLRPPRNAIGICMVITMLRKARNGQLTGLLQRPYLQLFL
jgi:hypothetical protein